MDGPGSLSRSNRFRSPAFPECSSNPSQERRSPNHQRCVLSCGLQEFHVERANLRRINLNAGFRAAHSSETLVELAVAVSQINGCEALIAKVPQQLKKNKIPRRKDDRGRIRP